MQHALWKGSNRGLPPPHPLMGMERTKAEGSSSLCSILCRKGIILEDYQLPALYREWQELMLKVAAHGAVCSMGNRPINDFH